MVEVGNMSRVPPVTGTARYDLSNLDSNTKEHPVRHLLSAALLLAFTANLSAAESAVSLKVNKDTVDVTIGGKPFAVYNFAKSLPKPFFSPVRGPEGNVMTRPIVNPVDHPHHKGIWVSVDEVNGIKFWAEKGKIANVSVKVLATKGDAAKLQVVNHWLGDDGKPVVTETTVIGIHSNRLLTYDITFTAGKVPVSFEDTKEGLLGFRMVDSMREKEGGKVTNAEGLKGSAACWGKRSAWVDYYGPVEGATLGVALFDHPKNFRPSRYHVRNYGLFSISPFGEKAYAKLDPATAHLQPGKSLQLKYGLYLHTGDTKAGKVTDVYKQYLKSAE
jgi:hypothetical protein